MNEFTMPLSSQDTADIQELAALALKGLSPREQRILKMRFGLDGTGEQSLADIARAMHLSRANVAAIEARALRKLRYPLRLISSGRLSRTDLQKAIKILSQFQKQTLTPQAVANTIKTQIPELSSLADVLPKTRSELYAFIQTLILILTLMLAVADYNRRSAPPQTPNVFINQPQIERVAPRRAPRTRRAAPT